MEREGAQDAVLMRWRDGAAWIVGGMTLAEGFLAEGREGEGWSCDGVGLSQAWRVKRGVGSVQLSRGRKMRVRGRRAGEM